MPGVNELAKDRVPESTLAVEAPLYTLLLLLRLLFRGCYTSFFLRENIFVMKSRMASDVAIYARPQPAALSVYSADLFVDIHDRSPAAFG